MKDEGRRNIRRGKESDTKQDEIRRGGKARGGGVGGERRKTGEERQQSVGGVGKTRALRVKMERRVKVEVLNESGLRRGKRDVSKKTERNCQDERVNPARQSRSVDAFRSCPARTKGPGKVSSVRSEGGKRGAK